MAAPFFLAQGFHRPHFPYLCAPEEALPSVALALPCDREV